MVGASVVGAAVVSGVVAATVVTAATVVAAASVDDESLLELEQAPSTSASAANETMDALALMAGEGSSEPVGAGSPSARRHGAATTRPSARRPVTEPSRLGVGPGVAPATG